MKGLKYQLKNICRDKMCILSFLLPVLVGLAINLLSGVSFSSLSEPAFYIIENDISFDTIEWLQTNGSVTAFSDISSLKNAVNDPATQGIGVLQDGDGIKTLLSGDELQINTVIGTDNKEMKSRREITCEFLFFELAAVGFLGIASMLFKEKQMGIIRVHGVLPVSKTAFILSKLCLFLLSDLVFSILLTVINLGISEGLSVLPRVCLQTGILSLLMALIGFFCSVLLQDFKQFSLLYLVLAVFITTPVFLVGQIGIVWDWIKYHPMYHLFMAMKNAYWGVSYANGIYYIICGLTIVLLFLLVRRALIREMAKEG